jgi:hypothetical protein
LSWDRPDAFPAGRYVVLYEGRGELAFAGGARLVSRGARRGRRDDRGGLRRVEVDFHPSRGNFQINLTAVDAAEPLRNIRVLMPGGVCSNDRFRWCGRGSRCDDGVCRPFEESYEEQVFHPIFLDRLRNYSVLRFMDWMGTNNSEQRLWEERPRLEDARWTTHGVPAEVMVALANRLGADPWFTVPHQADDRWVRSFAQLVLEQLDGGRKVYVEHSNEVWNGMFGQARYAREKGRSLRLSNNDFHAQVRYHSVRSVQIFSIFSSVFGGGDRLVRVMGSMAANPWVSEQVLDFRQAQRSTDALAIAPYFGGPLGLPAKQSKVSRMSVPDLLRELEQTSLPLAVSHMTKSAQVARRRGVRLIAYEGGQHLAGHGGVENNDRINRLFDEANRHPGMGELYDSYLSQWRASGGELFVHFVNCSIPSKWGRWGALEYLTQADRQAPKYQALQRFIRSNPRWW